MRGYKVALAAFSMMFACSGSVSAQHDLGNFIGSLLQQGATTNQKEEQPQKQDDRKGSLLEGLSSIFNKNKIAKGDELVGKWIFTSPAVIFESDNALQSMGGKLAAKRIEERITELINKYGLTKDAMTFDFDSEGNFNQVYKRLNLKGTYTVDEKNVMLKYAGRYRQLIGETQLDGSTLVIVMDAEKLNEYLIGIASLSPDPKAQILSQILSKIKGIKCGLRFEKVK